MKAVDAAEVQAGPSWSAAVGERFTRRVTFDADAIREFAALSGDHNPLHHDDAAGEASPFGRIIASGPHVVALMMGLDATYFSRQFDALGLASISVSSGPYRRARHSISNGPSSRAFPNPRCAVKLSMSKAVRLMTRVRST